MKALLSILILLMGMEAYAGVQTQDCADSKEGVRDILEKRYDEKNTSYLDALAGSWGPAGKPNDDGVVIRDGGALSLGGHYIRVCPQGNRVFWFQVKGFMAGGNTGFITINSSSSVTIWGGTDQAAKANGKYVKRKGQGNA
jgi:hypothetical protein